MNAEPAHKSNMANRTTQVTGEIKSRASTIHPPAPSVEVIIL